MGKKIMNRKNKKLHSKGFTLVELMVAAAIAILCITSVVAMLMKGREINTGDKYRRYSRALVISEFEDPQYHYSQYATIKTLIGTTTETVTIDKRGSYGDIQGTMTKIIGAEATISASGGANLPYIPITISIHWTTSDGSDTLTLTKFITEPGE